MENRLTKFIANKKVNTNRKAIPKRKTNWSQMKQFTFKQKLPPSKMNKKFGFFG